MNPVLIASRDNTSLSNLSAVLKENDVQVFIAESGANALSMISEQKFDLVIADETLSDMTGLEFARKLVSVNPMINCAMISSLSPEDFHEASEGLGILMQIPPEPDKVHAENLLNHLNKILRMTAGKD